MAAPPDGYDSGEYLSRNLTSEILSRCKYGIASVSNISGRGNIVLNAIVKRPRKHSKPVYDYANILGYIGGEIRDGYFKSNLKESEVIRMMQMHVDLSAGRWTRLAFAPVEDAAALCVLPLHAKSVENGFGFPDEETAEAFECLKKVARYSTYQSVEDFFSRNLGQGPQSPDRSKFDGGRMELQAWWLEKEDLLYHNCPLPPTPPSENLRLPESFLDFCSRQIKWYRATNEPLLGRKL